MGDGLPVGKKMPYESEVGAEQMTPLSFTYNSSSGFEFRSRSKSRGKYVSCYPAMVHKRYLTAPWLLRS